MPARDQLFRVDLDTATPWPWLGARAARHRRVSPLPVPPAGARAGGTRTTKRGRREQPRGARVRLAFGGAALRAATAGSAQALRRDAHHSRRLARHLRGRAARDHRSQRRRQIDALQPDQRTLCPHDRFDPARGRSGPGLVAVRDEPPRPCAQLPGHQHLPPDVGLREPPLQRSLVAGIQVLVSARRREARRCQRADRRSSRADRADRAARRTCRRADLRRAAGAGDRHHDRRRRTRDPARRAHRRHEPGRGRQGRRADPPSRRAARW